MLTLAMDTATRVAAVGICDGPRVLAAYEINMGHTHAEGLVPQLEQLLQRTGLKPSDLELIAVSNGPGSFTGLRIGLATAEAMAYALHIPLVGVSTPEALAYNLPVEGVLLGAVIDAQKGNFYFSVYEWMAGELKELRPVEIVAGARAGELLAAYNRPALILGEGEKLGELPAGIKLAPERVRLPLAASVAACGEAHYAGENKQDYFGMSPFYLRRSEAEELWEQKHSK